MKPTKALTWPAAVAVLLTASVCAQSATITVDENGHGLPFKIGTDPGPGGLTNVLIYTLPFTGLQGDVRMTDAECGGCFLDVVRFNADGTLIFYSDNIDGVDALADTPSPPLAFYPNLVSIPEVNGLDAFYTPTSNQPGWDSSNPTYHFISDTTETPEPTSMLFLASGLLVLAATLRRRL